MAAATMYATPAGDGLKDGSDIAASTGILTNNPWWAAPAG